jgi:hypothetical protein
MTDELRPAAAFDERWRATIRHGWGPSYWIEYHQGFMVEIPARHSWGAKRTIRKARREVDRRNRKQEERTWTIR